MGFDNECILNIHSVAAEYFCPVCRTLVYPNEALHTPCNHLYCPKCLVHIASSSRACPYDGCLITEACTKPLIETNKTLAEAIEKIFVRCLYHRSGCMWQGPLSACVVHCSGCAFGNSLVICMKCQIQIMHRQAEEHAQICNVNQVMNPQSTPAQSLNHPVMADPKPQGLPATVLPTSQWYQPQYEQNYQQYPFYDSYLQVYPQIYPYSLATQPFHQPPIQVYGAAQAPGQTQHSGIIGQCQSNLYPQAAMPGLIQNQAHLVPQQQLQSAISPNVQIQSQNQLPVHGHMPPQLCSQVQHAFQVHAQQQMQVPNIQQPQPSIGNPDSHSHIPQAEHDPPQAFHGLSQQKMQIPHIQQSQPSLGHEDSQPQPQSHPQVQLRSNILPLEPPQRTQAFGIRVLNQAGQLHQLPQSSITVHGAPHAKALELHSSQTHENMVNQRIQLDPSLGGAVVERKGDPALARTTKPQENKLEPLKNPYMDAIGLRANLNEMRYGADTNNDRKRENHGREPYWQLGGSFAPCSAAMLAKGPNNFTNHVSSFEPQYPGLHMQYSQSHTPIYGPPNFIPSSAPPHCYGTGQHIDQGCPRQPHLIGDSSGTKSTNPHLGEPGPQSGYTPQGFPNAGPFHADGSDSSDNLRKRKMSLGWCRICEVDCQSVQGLEMHCQTHDHQRISMDMAHNIKQKSARVGKYSFWI